MKCYKDGCLNKVEYMIIIEFGKYSCEEHAAAIGSYVKPL